MTENRMSETKEDKKARLSLTTPRDAIQIPRVCNPLF